MMHLRFQRPEFRFPGQIWVILPGFWPFRLDLGQVAYIWAIRQNFGQNGPQWRWSPKEQEGGKDVHTDRSPPSVLKNFAPFGLLPKHHNFGHFQLFLPFLAPWRGSGGYLRGSYPLFLNYHSLPLNIFQTRPFPRISISPLGNYKGA